MPCPECKSTIMIVVRCDIHYIEELYTFSEGNVLHIHDPNPRVATWKCGNDHEYETTAIMPCFGCIFERLMTSDGVRIEAIRTPYAQPVKYQPDDHIHSDFGFSHSPDLV